MRYYAVNGRIPGDDEETTYLFQADSKEHAIEQFENAIWDGKDPEHEDRVTTTDSHGVDTYINVVLVSDSPIEDAA